MAKKLTKKQIKARGKKLMRSFKYIRTGKISDIPDYVPPVKPTETA